MTIISYVLIGVMLAVFWPHSLALPGVYLLWIAMQAMGLLRALDSKNDTE